MPNEYLVIVDSYCAAGSPWTLYQLRTLGMLAYTALLPLAVTFSV
jgi:hypothetical protein